MSDFARWNSFLIPSPTSRLRIGKCRCFCVGHWLVDVHEEETRRVHLWWLRQSFRLSSDDCARRVIVDDHLLSSLLRCLSETTCSEVLACYLELLNSSDLNSPLLPDHKHSNFWLDWFSTIASHYEKIENT